MAGRPTIRRRRLAAELRQLREASGLTAEEAAARLNEVSDGWSKSKVSRVENAEWKRPRVRDVRDMLDVYGVTDERERDGLITIAREAGQRGWWTAYGDVFTGSFIGFEAEASAIRSFEPTLVPGLLHTEDYARAIFESERPAAQPDEIERRVTARMARRQVLDRDDPPEFWAVIDEAAMTRAIGGAATMRGQLDSLIDVSARTNVELQILPASAGAHPGIAGAFVVLEFEDPGDDPVVYLETATDGIYLEKPEEVKTYRQRFELICAQALGPRESIAYMAKLRDSLR